MKQDMRAATAVDKFVGAQLKLLRKGAKLSQSDLAEKVGVTFQQIQKYERGTNRIGASRLWDFCKVFDVNPGHFFEGLDAHLDRLAQLRQEDEAASIAPDSKQKSLIGAW